mmetsp:Transcript_12770/g.28052  ORF Transcript_12770/g.28052 Transcript_12770/m.28052 type:complete len:226 (-) Transcript_12770:139-816(-)
MRLVQNHISRRHGYIVGVAVVVIGFQNPFFIYILIHVDDCRANQRKSIHMGRKDGIILIHANAVNRRWRQCLARPFGNGVARRVGNGRHEWRTTPFQFLVGHVQNVGLSIPAVVIGRCAVEFLCGVVAIFIPKLLNESVHAFRCLDLFEARSGVISNGLGLVQVSLHTLQLGLLAECFSFALRGCRHAVSHVIVVHCLFVAELVRKMPRVDGPRCIVKGSVSDIR